MYNIYLYHVQNIYTHSLYITERTQSLREIYIVYKKLEINGQNVFIFSVLLKLLLMRYIIEIYEQNVIKVKKINNNQMGLNGHLVPHLLSK